MGDYPTSTEDEQLVTDSGGGKGRSSGANVEAVASNSAEAGDPVAELKNLGPQNRPRGENCQHPRFAADLRGPIAPEPDPTAPDNQADAA